MRSEISKARPRGGLGLIRRISIGNSDPLQADATCIHDWRHHGTKFVAGIFLVSMKLARAEPLRVQVHPPETGGEGPLRHQEPGERFDAVSSTSLGGLVVAHGRMIG